MSWLSNSITSFGLLFLAHAGYSAYEHSALLTTSSDSAPGSPTLNASIPLDISIETILAIFLVCFGLVIGAPQLRPIQWRVWAGKIEREGENGFRDSNGEVAKDYMGNPFRTLESRPGFVDIRRQRREFASWIREGGTVDARSKI